MVRFAIEFDRPDRKYSPGEIVNCTVRYSVTSPSKCRSIYARFRGFAKVKWTESRTVQRNGKSHTEHTTYHAEEEYFKSYETVQGVNGGKYQRHDFVFSVTNDKIYCL